MFSAHVLIPASWTRRLALLLEGSDAWGERHERWQGQAVQPLGDPFLVTCRGKVEADDFVHTRVKELRCVGTFRKAPIVLLKFADRGTGAVTDSVGLVVETPPTFE